MKSNHYILIVLFCLSTSFTFSFSNELNTVILSSKNDPYYKLAEVVAESEGIPIFETIEEVISAEPSFLLWIVSPSFLSNQIIVDFGMKMKNIHSNISTGIITGKTLEEAKSLYERGKHKPEIRKQVIVNMEMSSSNIKPEIIVYTDSSEKTLPLTKTNLIQSLQTSDYFTGHLHGSPKIWAYQDSSDIVRILPSDISGVNNSIIIAHSCDNFRLWEENSFVLPFVVKGIAAYAGFSYKPNTGFIFGEFNDLNYKYTWEGFPIGHIVQVQNHASLQGYANFPYFFLLGDPRISFQNTKPYEIEFDKMVDENHRYLKLVNVKKGVVPVRINNGANYDFVNIPGIGSSDINDYFFNNSLQMINVNNDKFVLLKNNNDELTIYLKNKACIGWSIFNFTADVLDTGLIYLQNSGAILFFIIGIIICCILLIQIVRKKLNFTQWKASLFTGLLILIISTIYILLRIDRITITESIIKFNLLLIINIVVFTMAGTIIYFRGKNLFQKIIAFMVAVLPAFISMVITFLGLFMTDHFMYRKLLNEQLYNYKLPLMCFYALIFEVIVFGISIKIAETILQKKKVI